MQIPVSQLTVSSAPAKASGRVVYTGGDITTVPGFGTIFNAALTVTITTAGSTRALVIFSAWGNASGNLADISFDCTVDGTRQGGTNGLGTRENNSGQGNLSFFYLTDVLSAGSHTFTIQASSVANCLVYASATSPTCLFVVEI